MNIQTSCGIITQVDEDCPARDFCWHVNTYGYAVNWSRRVKSLGSGLLHRLVLNAPKGMEVDHINGDRLDNRRENLRLVTRQQNARNRGANRSNRSGYKGVSLGHSAWLAYIAISGKNIALGSFKTAEDAAKAYNEAAIKLFGEHARLNKERANGKP